MTTVNFCIKTRSKSRSETPTEQEESFEQDLKPEERITEAQDFDSLDLAENQLQDTEQSLGSTSTSETRAESSEDNQGPDSEEDHLSEEDEDMAERGPIITPPKFSGGLGTQVEEYLAQFERVAKANGWNDAKKLVIIPCYLEGAALKWYENLEQKLGQEITWQLVKDNMKEAFQAVAWDEQLEYRLRLRMQGEEESVENYVQDVTNLCAKVDPNMAEKAKIKHVLRGLKPSLLEKVMLMDNDTLENLMKNIRKVQTARFMAGQRVDHILELPSRAAGPSDIPTTSSTSKLESQLDNLTKEFSRLSMKLLEHQTSRERPLPPVHAGDSSRAPWRQAEGRPFRRQESRGSGVQETDGERGQGRGIHQDSGRRGYRGPGRGRTADGRVICFKCNRVGHYAVACRSGSPGNEEGGR